MSGWRKRTITKMAREAGFEQVGHDSFQELTARMEAFAKLVREEATTEANARANASWTLMCEKMVAVEREACAVVVEAIEARCVAKDVDDPPLTHVAAAIRARGNT
jgi:hypothetical protein